MHVESEEEKAGAKYQIVCNLCRNRPMLYRALYQLIGSNMADESNADQQKRKTRHLANPTLT
jgi:hypothetical protein